MKVNESTFVFNKACIIAMSTGFGRYDVNILFYVILVVLGVVVGSYVHTKITTDTIQQVFNIAVFSIIILNIMIVIKNF